MTTIGRKVMTAVALVVVGGLVIGGTMAFAGDATSPSPAAISSATIWPSASDAHVSDDDDGTPDQGPGDFPFDAADDADDDGDADDNSGPSENSGPGSTDDNSGPSENSGPGSADDDSGHGGDDD